jgi:large subunit ribosomal protein L10
VTSTEPIAHARSTPNPEKADAIAELTEQFSRSSAAVITEYRGLSVKQLTTLRRALGSNTTYAIVKNTLTKRAAAEAGIPIDDSLLTGPVAIAFIAGDPVEAAKGLRDFAKANPPLVIKGGVLDGKALTAAEVSRIADLESREVLLAKLAGALKALPTRAAGLFQAPLSQMARLMAALEEKKPAEGSSRPEQSSGETAPAASADTGSDSSDSSDSTNESAAEAEVPVAEAVAEAAEAPQAPAEPAE